MSEIESSPSVRRSNSYRTALCKSGVPKEYIEELERMQLNDLKQHNNGASIETRSKKTLFKRNYRGLHSKQRLKNGEEDGLMSGDKNEATLAISINSSSAVDDTKHYLLESEHHKDGSSRSSDEDEDNEKVSGENGAHNYANPQKSQQQQQQKEKSMSQRRDGGEESSGCRHLCCLLCCCNYCCFLPSSVRDSLQQKSSYRLTS